jgi:hypothetical protein
MCILTVACSSRAPHSRNAFYRQSQQSGDAGKTVPAVDITQQAKETEELLGEMSGKMDEYQDLLATCERIGDSEADAGYRATCKTLLGDLKKEILKLSEHFPSREADSREETPIGRRP